MVSFNHNVGVAFALSSAAGFATVLGGCVIFSKRLVYLANPMSLAMALSISGGVMVFISFVEIFNKSVSELTEGFKAASPDLHVHTANGHGFLAAATCFAVGIALIYCIDWIVHKISPEAAATELEHLDFRRESIDLSHASKQSPVHGGSYIEAPATSDGGAYQTIETKAELDRGTHTSLVRMGVLTAVAIGLHNIPEGIATFVGALKDPSVGASLAVGIGIHNIPEGIAVATPIYFATRSKSKAIMWCFISAVAEPIGAVLAWLVVGDGLNLIAEGILFGLVCGIMVAISMKELFPTAYKFAKGRTELVAIGSFAGMFIMVSSLILFAYAGV